MSLAGNVEFEHAKDIVEKAFGDWKTGDVLNLTQTPPPGNFKHEPQQSEQTHIGIAYGSIPKQAPSTTPFASRWKYFPAGMSGRLFTEIREKKGLVYNVSAGYSSLKGNAAIFGYAGTSNERAQETLDTFIAELFRLTQGVTAEELERAKTGLKASTIMQGESTSSPRRRDRA